MATKDLITRDPERWLQLNALVDAGASFSEIRRVMGTDPRTVKKWFPNYHPYPVGGGGEAAEIRETNRKLNFYLQRGRLPKKTEDKVYRGTKKQREQRKADAATWVRFGGYDTRFGD